MKNIEPDEWEDFDPDEESNTCDYCGRGPDDAGQCPDCCTMGQYSPGSEICDTCEYSGECAEGA